MGKTLSDFGDSELLLQLCSGQNLAVLSTEADARPYASLVAVAMTSDLRHLFFATPRATRKYANLSTNPRVALLLDNRTNQVADFSRAAAATVLGVAQELSAQERDKNQAFYLERHPHLAEFAASPSTALFRVRVESIYLVTRFQSVMEYHFTP
ncbi:pyridoxamine 5'-phosphate oxidase family protein [Geoalkalibacter sp.]|uniref:pyridoxamine 5'-phosphate oxidase family protein n=1 Tax=Geoalkalibacter sp. TaxID=3041440 RepID=UPI00272E8E3B|nr:pyridoxamine 5'-phosphate oxidase family protein [Geoalkalibacter sp.]